MSWSIYPKITTRESRTPFAIELSTPYYDENSCDHNVLHIAVGKWGWYWDIPSIIHPKEMWVDASQPTPSFAGYTKYIRKAYGFCVFEESVHMHYGIQPGCWSRGDPENSDHTKVFNFPWTLTHVRHSAYYLPGEYACCGEYLRQWVYQHVDNKPYNVETRNSDFQNVPWFVHPTQDLPEYIKAGKNIFSDSSTDTPIFGFFEYTDPQDGEVTVARVNIEEREWIRGKWAWLRAVLKYIPGGKLVRRTMEITFRSEVGKRKGSWKGGVIGMGVTMTPGETVYDCWQRFVAQNKIL